MREQGDGKRYLQAAALLPPHLRRQAEQVDKATQAVAEELRLRSGWPMTVVSPQGERQVPGEEPVTPGDLELVLEIAKVIRLGFLQQNAFHPDDTCVSLEKQYKMMEVILYLYKKSKALVTMGMPMSVLKEDKIFDRVVSIKYDVPNDRLDLFDTYKKDIDTFYDKVLEKNG